MVFMVILCADLKFMLILHLRSMCGRIPGYGLGRYADTVQ